MPSSAAALTVNPNDGDLAISPDGRRLVYTSTSAVSTAAQLIVRAIDQFEGKPIQGLGSPRHPFISPDGQRIGFFDGVEALKKVSIDGGAAVTICRVNGRPRGATWGPDDTIVFATDDPATGLARVPAAGGEPQVLTRPDRQQEEDDHLWPEFLPNGRAVLFTIVDRGNFRIAALGWPGGERKALIPSRTADADARVTFSGRSQDPVWTPDGTRLVFGNDVRGGNETDLFWAPWDASTQLEPLLVREHSQDPHAWSPDGRALARWVLRRRATSPL